MENLEKILAEAGILPELADLMAPEAPCYLVGGALRNLLLGLPVADFDFATPGDPTDLAKRWATTVGGSWFSLDAARRQSRVVARAAGRPITFDFAPFRAPDLEKDLKLRDFTVNALAWRLGSGSEKTLIDPLGGRLDLAAGRLRCCSRHSLADDPLRILKGIRHCAELGLSVADDTLGQMRRASARLEQTAPERIRGELVSIFSVPSAVPFLYMVNRVGAWPVLLGSKAADIPAGSALVGKVEGVLGHLDRHADFRFLRPTLDQQIEEGLERRTLVKLAAFLRGCGIAELPALCRERLRLGRRATAVIGKLGGLEPERARELARLRCGPRGRALWSARFGPGRLEALLLLAALEPTLLAADREAFRKTAAAVGEYPEEKPIPDLVSGDWLIRHLGLQPGPLYGKLLEKVRSEEVAGRIRTPEQARKYLISLKEKGIDKA